MTVQFEHTAAINASYQHKIAHGVSTILRAHQVQFGLWSGMHAALIGKHRPSNDVDFLIADEHMPLVEELFPACPVFLGNNDRRIVRLGTNDDIEMMSHMDIMTPIGAIALRMTPLVQKYTTERHLGAWRLPCVDPAETILLKGILQRGEEVGKHDVKDIRAIMGRTAINTNYLQARIEETGAEARVGALFADLDLLGPSPTRSYC